MLLLSMLHLPGHAQTNTANEAGKAIDQEKLDQKDNKPYL